MIGWAEVRRSLQLPLISRRRGEANTQPQKFAYSAGRSLLLLAACARLACQYGNPKTICGAFSFCAKRARGTLSTLLARIPAEFGMQILMARFGFHQNIKKKNSS
jgi:hypothetical protein